jgi:HEAT repeat protein
VLAGHFEKSSAGMDRSFAALALALCGDEREATLIRADLEKLEGEQNALGAQALALGLLGDSRPETVGLLSQIACDRGLDPRLRGGAVVALGLIGDDPSMKVVYELLGDRWDFTLRANLAFAVGLNRDQDAIALLLRIFDDPKAGAPALEAAAAALGRIGGEGAIAKLIDILEPESKNGKYPELARCAAAVALGRIAAGGGDGGISRIAPDYNYCAPVQALDQVLRTP